MQTTLTAQFDRPDLVPHAARRLCEAGFSEADITLHTIDDSTGAHADHAPGPGEGRDASPAPSLRRWIERVRHALAHAGDAGAAGPANTLTLRLDDQVTEMQRAWILLCEEGASAIDSARPAQPPQAPVVPLHGRAGTGAEALHAAGPLSMQYSRQNEPALFAGQSLQEALPHLARYRPEEPAGTAPEPELGSVDWLDLPVVRRSCEEQATEEGPEAEYRRHWRMRYPGVPFADVEAGYEFGAEMSCGERYNGHSWDQAEPCLRDDWEAAGKGDWDRIAPAVRFGWELFRHDAP